MRRVCPTAPFVSLFSSWSEGRYEENTCFAPGVECEWKKKEQRKKVVTRHAHTCERPSPLPPSTPRHGGTGVRDTSLSAEVRCRHDRGSRSRESLRPTATQSGECECECVRVSVYVFVFVCICLCLCVRRLSLRQLHSLGWGALFSSLTLCAHRTQVPLLVHCFGVKIVR